MKVNVHDPRGEELAQVLTRATAALAQVPSPRVDAELLAAHLLYDGSRSRLQHAALMGERPAAPTANRCSTSPAPLPSTA